MDSTVTLSSSAAVKADTTNGTYAVGNDEFLMAVFGSAPAATGPVVVSFDGDPTKVAARSWFGRPWQTAPTEATGLAANTNNYFSLATFRPDEVGQYRRQKERFSALHA